MTVFLDGWHSVCCSYQTPHSDIIKRTLNLS